MRLSRFLLGALLLFNSITSPAQQTIGLFQNDPGSKGGYVLFSPMMPKIIPDTIKKSTYLIDKCGREIHQWTSAYPPGASVYFLPDGTLLRAGDVGNMNFMGGGEGGIIERLDWNSKVVWSYTISDANQCQHHDICYLPNGDILAIVWEKKNRADAIANGINPTKVGTVLWSEKIIQLRPIDSNKATIVWEWHVWDHLVQDFSPSSPNYGVVSNHPELININYNANASNQDWLHINSVAYNADLDQILLSVHNFSEIWIIDHSTSTAQAASHTGGKYGKGGDLLYRWGNPAAYDNGTSADKRLFTQHNAHWIPNGLKDSGKIMIFNNGVERIPALTDYSSVDIIAPPINASGSYDYTSGAYKPDTAEWSYVADTPSNFYAVNMSGCQRLANGNTLICSAPTGEFFEIDSNKKKVWDYINPINSLGPIRQGIMPSLNMVFRCALYEKNYPGFAGHTLTPGDPLEIDPLPYTCIETNVPNINKAGFRLSATNPITNKIVLRSAKSIPNTTVILTDLTGRSIANWNHIYITADQPSYLDISDNVIPGIYILSVSSSGYSQYIKLVKE